MIKPSDPKQLAIDIIGRSICNVMAGAAIADSRGRILSWGWNSCGLGLGEHAEQAAMRRANKQRLPGATIYIASQRRRNRKCILSAPCEDCRKLLFKWEVISWYRDSDHIWKLL